MSARKKLGSSEKQLSGIIYERLGDDFSFGRMHLVSFPVQTPFNVPCYIPYLLTTVCSIHSKLLNLVLLSDSEIVFEVLFRMDFLEV